MERLVEALDTYEKENIRDSQLCRIPKKGEQFEVTDKRLKVLLGDNDYQLVFAKLVEKESLRKTKKEADK